ncbi:small membrane protein YkgR, partial [Escherichia coli]
SDPGPVFHTIVSIKNDGHYFCRAGGNRPDGLNEPVTNMSDNKKEHFHNVIIRWVIIFATIEYIYLFIKFL